MLILIKMNANKRMAMSHVDTHYKLSTIFIVCVAKTHCICVFFVKTNAHSVLNASESTQLHFLKVFILALNIFRKINN